jgi:hypothetical protein
MTTANDTQQLRQLMLTTFNKEELEILCADLDVNYENLVGEMLERKLLSLIVHMHQHGATAQLLAMLKQRRSNIDWDSIHITAANLAPALQEATGNADVHQQVLLGSRVHVGQVEQQMDERGKQVVGIGDESYIQGISQVQGKKKKRFFPWW